MVNLTSIKCDHSIGCSIISSMSTMDRELIGGIRCIAPRCMFSRIHQESNCVFCCHGVGVESRAALRCQILKRRCCFCARTAQGRPGPLPPAKACCTAHELISRLPCHAPWRVSAAPRSAAWQLRPRHWSAAMVAAT